MDVRVWFALVALPLFGWPLIAQTPDSTADSAKVTSAATMHELLLGRVAGVLVYPNTGSVGTGARIRIRGVGSLSLPGQPAVYVDGVRVEADERGLALGMEARLTSGVAGRLSSRLDDFNPEDVDSIVIARGPAAGALHGPELATGAILVFTKRGHAGPARWRAYAEEGRAFDATPWPGNYGGVDADHADSVYRNGACTLQAEARGLCVQDFVRSFAPLVRREQFRAAPRRQYGVAVSGTWRAARYALGAEIESEGGVYELSDGEVDRLIAAGGVAAAPEDVIHPSYLRRGNLYGNVGLTIGRRAEIDLTFSGRTLDIRLPHDGNTIVGLPYVGLLGSSDSMVKDGWYAFRPGDLFQRITFQEVERFGGGVRFAWRAAPFLELTGLAGFDELEQRDAPRPRPYQVIDRQAAVGRRTFSLGASASFGRPGGLSGRARLAIHRLDYRLDARLLEEVRSPADTSLLARYEARLFPDLGTTNVAAEQELGWRDRVVLGVGMRLDDFEVFVLPLGGFFLAPGPGGTQAPQPGTQAYPAARLSWTPIAARRVFWIGSTSVLGTVPPAAAQAPWHRNARPKSSSAPAPGCWPAAPDWRSWRILGPRPMCWWRPRGVGASGPL